MENVAINNGLKGRGGNDVQHQKNTGKEKIIRIWITTIRHGGLGHKCDCLPLGTESREE